MTTKVALRDGSRTTHISLVRDDVFEVNGSSVKNTRPILFKPISKTTCITHVEFGGFITELTQYKTLMPGDTMQFPVGALTITLG